MPPSWANRTFLAYTSKQQSRLYNSFRVLAIIALLLGSIYVAAGQASTERTGNYTGAVVPPECSTFLSSYRLCIGDGDSDADDVGLDGPMLWSPCARSLGLDVQPVKMLLLSHKVATFEDASEESHDLSWLVQEYSNASGVSFDLRTVSSEWWSSLSNMGSSALDVNLTQYAAWVVPPSALSGLYDAGLLQPLDSLLTVSPDLAIVWQDIPEVFREVASVYDGSILSIPYTAEIPLLFWRRDVFSQLGLNPPATWEEAVAVARRINGTQVPCIDDPSQQCEQAGFCYGLPDGCFYDGMALATVWASMVGAYGTDGGLYFDPTNMKPLFTGAAMKEALRLYRELLLLGPNDTGTASGAACGRHSLDVYLRKCAIGVSLTTLFKQWGFAADGTMRGRFGVSMLPGADKVQDRTTGLLAPCTSALCPFAEMYNGTTLISRVPYLGRGAFSLAINRQAPPNHVMASLRAFIFAMNYKDGWTLAMDPATDTTPVRTGDLSTDIAEWGGWGFNQEDMQEYVAAITKSMGHPCMSAGMRIPGAVDMEVAMAEVATAVLDNGATPGRLCEVLNQRYSEMLNRRYDGNPAAFQAAYIRDIGYGETRATSRQQEQQPPPPSSDSSRSLSPDGVLGLAVGMPAAAVLLAVAGSIVLLKWWQARKSSGRGGCVLSPPGYSPDTSLCITDIQSSTMLWEELDPGVMDVSLSLHNSCIRRLLSKHQGYECHTEGDSFIIAFPMAVCAVDFAMEMQVALMHLPWPEELLLSCPDCSTVYHTTAAATAAAAKIGTPYTQTVTGVVRAGGSISAAAQEASQDSVTGFTAEGAGDDDHLAPAYFHSLALLAQALAGSSRQQSITREFERIRTINNSERLLARPPTMVNGVACNDSSKLDATAVSASLLALLELPSLSSPLRLPSTALSPSFRRHPPSRGRTRRHLFTVSTSSGQAHAFNLFRDCN
ncbi:hypothetical protein Agub_g6420, partial [Astrephomene gubernaculifera]